MCGLKPLFRSRIKLKADGRNSKTVSENELEYAFGSIVYAN